MSDSAQQERDASVTHARPGLNTSMVEHGYLSLLTRVEQDFDDVCVNFFSLSGAN